MVVNFNGRAFLGDCLDSLRAQDYPREQVEVVLVDNASTDGSLEFVRARYPDVRIHANDHNAGFAPAVNQAADDASGEILALINNDAVAERAWLRELVWPLIDHPEIGCTGGLVLDEDGEHIQFAGGAMTFYGMGIELRHGDRFTPEVEDELVAAPSIFVTGSSLATPRELFLRLRGFDRDYFAFYEDVDYGWRLWVTGYEVRFVPRARIRHRMNATVARFSKPTHEYLLERNALYSVFKNYDDTNLGWAFSSSLLLSVRRGLRDKRTLLPDYRIGDFEREIGEPDVSAYTGAHIAALRDVTAHLPELRAKRAFVQQRRRRTDDEITPLFHHPFAPRFSADGFLDDFAAIVHALDVPQKFARRHGILIIPSDPIGDRMSGPAIRAWEMASALSRDHDVIVLSRGERFPPTEDFRVERLHGERLQRLVRWANIVIAQGPVMTRYPQIVNSSVYLVIDLYDPFHIEALEATASAPEEQRWFSSNRHRAVLDIQLRRGDLFLCASEQQRLFWLGHLAAAGRLNPATYDADPQLRQLIEVAPFGLPDAPPEAARGAVKGVVPGIGVDDLLILWGGGIYDWFDPVTVIRAVAKAAVEEPRLRLLFVGTGHPNPDVPAMAAADDARAAAEELGAVGRLVFFNDGWIPYARRGGPLVDADVGVSAHIAHLETELSYRTRMLDYLWARLPIVCTAGDEFAALVAEHDLGEVVEVGDIDGFAAALLRSVAPGRREQVAANIERLVGDFTWERTLDPLLRYASRPRRAPDLIGEHAELAAGARAARTATELVRSFAHVSRGQGIGTATRMALDVVRRRVQR